eukprot:6174334-Pleurochrysis_carterae.AAC.3
MPVASTSRRSAAASLLWRNAKFQDELPRQKKTGRLASSDLLIECEAGDFRARASDDLAEHAADAHLDDAQIRRLPKSGK